METHIGKKVVDFKLSVTPQLQEEFVCLGFLFWFGFLRYFV